MKPGRDEKATIDVRRAGSAAARLRLLATAASVRGRPGRGPGGPDQRLVAGGPNQNQRGSARTGDGAGGAARLVRHHGQFKEPTHPGRKLWALLQLAAGALVQARRDPRHLW